jgi:alkylresorcinol/alkylpyrone synthase
MRSKTPDQLIAHTGGRDVIEAIECAIPSQKLCSTREVLRQYGNISSPSVLAALEHCLESNLRSDNLWLTAFGAGFAAHCGELQRSA